MPHPRGRFLQRGMTLMELMAVIFIIVLMMGISVTAIVQLNRGEGLNQATRQMCNALMVARGDAIANHRRVRIVFLGSAANISASAAIGSASNFPKVYRAYSIIAKTAGTLDDTRSDSWSFTSGWEYLPTGIVFSAGSVNGLPSSTPLNLSSGPAIMNYIEFRPSGRATTAATLSLAEGQVTGSGNSAITTQYGTLNITNIFCDNIIGRIKVFRPQAGTTTWGD